ncbi:MAG: glycosyltransferase family 4 protein [Candidatus Helarchaeota archaeon]
MISIDSSIIREDLIEGFKGSIERHKIYGQYLKKLSIVVKVNKKINVKNIVKNVKVYPICTKNSIFFIFKAIKLIKGICKKEKIDVITTQDAFFLGLVGYLIKWKFKIPLIVQVHGDVLDNPYWLKEKKINYLLNLMGKYLIKKADGVRVVSKKIEKYMKLQKVKRIFNIPIYPDINDFSEFNNKKEKKNILFVGRLVPFKNIPLLIESMDIITKKHSNLSLIIIGVGPEKKKLVNLVKKYKLEKNIKFIGFVKDIRNYYYSSKFLILTSYYEGWGRVLSEARACGLPIITTDVGGARELVIDGVNGFIVPIGNKKILAEKICYLIEHPDILEQMRNKSKKMILQNNIEKTAEMLAKMYKFIVEEVKKSEF